MKKSIVYCILDGFGLSGNKENNPLFEAKIPNLRSLFKSYKFTTLSADGSHVGQEDGLVGNSEVGHINLGGLKLVKQLSYQITKSSETDFENDISFDAQLINPKTIIESFIQKDDNIHLMGLFSTASIHSDLRHLKSLIKTSLGANCNNVVLHLITDGRDTNRQSFLGTLKSFWADLEFDNIDLSRLVIGSIGGRYFSMDRDKNFDRVELGLSPLIDKFYKNTLNVSNGNLIDKIEEYVDNSYQNEVFDENMLPLKILTNNQDFALKNTDLIIVTNFRSDRAKQMTTSLLDFKKINRGLKILIMADYNLLPIIDQNLESSYLSIFRASPVKNTLSDYVQSLDKNQLNIAETEKYAHVTYFFDGGSDNLRSSQQRVIIPSNKVASHAQKPEMKTKEVTDYIINEGISNYDLVVVNYACSDMVGHTGDYKASIIALECLDENLGRLVSKINQEGHTMVLTADHGNIEVVGGTGATFDTEHNPNPVPLVLISSKETQNAIDNFDLKAFKTNEFYDSLELSNVITHLKNSNPISLNDSWFAKNQIPSSSLNLFHAGVLVAYLLNS